MRFVKFSPFAPAGGGQNLNHLVDELLNQGIGHLVGNDGANTLPSVNISESEVYFKLELAAPGMKKGDFKINVEKDILTVSASSVVEPAVKTGEEKDGYKVVRKEFGYTDFKRSFTLPEHVDTEGIVAAYEQGILSVVVPKVVVKKTAREIVID
jgi:HSP20 family protein